MAFGVIDETQLPVDGIEFDGPGGMIEEEAPPENLWVKEPRCAAGHRGDRG